MWPAMATIVGSANEFVGDCCATFRGAAIVFDDQFELEAIDVTAILNGNHGALRDVNAKLGIVAGHGSAHADFDGLAGFDLGATELIR